MWWKFRTASDADIVRRVLSGQRDKFSVLVERYLAVVQAVAYARTGNRADAQDVAQDTFLTAFEKLDTVRDVSSIGAWLTSIARHRAVRLVQQREHRAELQVRNLPREPEAHMPSPEKTEIRELLRQEVLRLDEDYREVLMLHYFAGKKIREVAALLDITVDAAKKRLQRAREALSVSLATQLPELLEADEPREKQVSRIMGVVAMATPPWQGASAALAGGAVSATSALTLKLALGATVLVVSGGLLWSWRAPDSEDSRLSVVENHTASATSASAEGTPSDSNPATTASQTPEASPSRRSLSDTLSNATTKLKQAVFAASNGGLSVSGSVVDAGGNPVPAAKVKVRIDDPGKQESTDADINGHFVVGELPQTHTLYVQATSPEDEPLLFESAVAGPLELQDTDITALILTLDQPRDRTLAGTVVDVTGKPIEGVGVLANAQDHRQFGNNVWTDARGQFSIPGLAAGNYRIGLCRPGLPPGQRSWSIKGDAPVYTIPEDQDLTGVVITFDDYGSLSIEGLITDVRGNPIVGARIHLNGGASDEASSGKNGRYSVNGLPPGNDYEVMVYDSNHTTQRVENVSAGQTNVDFVLTELGALEGTVLDAQTGLPIPEFEIGYSGEIPTAIGTLYLGTQNWWESFKDSDGRFELTKLNALWTQVNAKSTGYSPNQIRVKVEPGLTTSDVELRLEPSRTVNGVVLDTEGAPIAGAVVLIADRLQQGVDLERAASDRTSKDGTFRLDTIPADADSILVCHPDYVMEKVTVTSAPDQTVEVTLIKGGRLEGAITLAGEPVRNASLSLEGYSEGTGQWTVPTTLDPATGHFEFAHVYPGAAGLSVRLPPPDGSTVARQAARIVQINDAETTTLDIDFPTYTASLEGLVTIDGAAASDAHVSLTTGTTEHKEILDTRTDEYGVYAFEQAPSGTGRLVVVYFEGKAGYDEQTDVNLQPGVVSRMDVEFRATHEE